MIPNHMLIHLVNIHLSNAYYFMFGANLQIYHKSLCESG